MLDTLGERLWRVIWDRRRCVAGGRPLALERAWKWHRLGGRLTSLLSPLSPRLDRVPLDPAGITDAEVRAALQERPFTLWGIDVDCLNILVSHIREHRVRRVIEFGSGFSTVAAAIACRRFHAPGGPQLQVLSVDESEEYASRTRQLLEDVGVGDNVQIVVSPLTERLLVDSSVMAYSQGPIERHAGPGAGWLADLVFVDGPSSGGLARAAAALDGIASGRPGCQLLMDDGLRVFELKSMQSLVESGVIVSPGVIAEGKGMAVGEKR